jgi:hypothetical protein
MSFMSPEDMESPKRIASTVVASRPTNAQCGSNTDADGDKLLAFREVCFYNTDPNVLNTDGDACNDGRVQQRR